MKYKHHFIIFIFTAVIVGAGVLSIINSINVPSQHTDIGLATSTMILDLSVSDDLIKLMYPSIDFVFATTSEQVLVHTYIPPCEDGFYYCLYYSGTRYVGTNFESAGLSLKRRADLIGEVMCLNTSPYGNVSTVVPDLNGSNERYSWSEFLNSGDAVAGHYTSGSLYRLFVKGKPSLVKVKSPQGTKATSSIATNISMSRCYEIVTRIGKTQFANYPTKPTREFTKEDQDDVQKRLKNIVEHISLSSGEKWLFQ